MRAKQIAALFLALTLTLTLCGTAAADPRVRYGTYGTAKHMAGRTVVVSVFASDSKTSWDFSSDKDVKRYSIAYQDLRMACEWLSEQAASYGVKAEFIWDWLAFNDLYYTCSFDRKMIMYPSKYEEYYDYIDANVPTDELLKKYNAENILYIFHYDTPKSNSEGSHAYPFVELDDNVCGYEIVVMFTGLFDSIATPGTYAHEMLHLFGVPDMYAKNETYRMSKDFIKWYQNRNEWDIMAGAHTGDYSRMHYTFSEIVAYYAGLCSRPAAADRWNLRQSDYELYG